jgi:hypothetical protein
MFDEPFVWLCGCVAVAQELFDSFNKKLRAGQPGFHRGSYMIQENCFFHIPAGTEVG